MPERTEHRNESVRVLDLVVVDSNMTSWLDSHDFVDCEIVGPVVLMFAGDHIAFEESTLDVQQFWRLDAGRGYAGGVGMRNCRFHRCSFRDVGIAAPPQVLAQFGVAI